MRSQRALPGALFAVAVLLSADVAWARTLKLKVDGSKADAIKMTEQLNKHGADKGLQFTMVDSDFEFRVAVATEGYSTADVLFGGGADSSAAVLSPQCELLFVVSRSGRMTSGGALNAVSKELVKKFASYLKATGGEAK
jgi:hypothetical protein